MSSKSYSTSYSYISTEVILSIKNILNIDVNNFFSTSNTWIEIQADILTVFEYDRNRKLHFDEGFLNSCYYIFKNQSIRSISSYDHFPYKDLNKFRNKILSLKDSYQKGVYVPPPLFYYSNSHQLQILDGVHRSIALYDQALLNDNKEKCDAQNAAKIWIGFDHQRMSIDTVADHFGLIMPDGFQKGTASI
jgi:hypothetical protein